MSDWVDCFDGECEAVRARLRTGEGFEEGGVGGTAGRLERGMTEPVFFQRTPHALHRVFGPAGPARQSGVSVASQLTQRRASGRRAGAGLAEATGSVAEGMGAGAGAGGFIGGEDRREQGAGGGG